jgi:hypothetical protein
MKMLDSGREIPELLVGRLCREQLSAKRVVGRKVTPHRNRISAYTV